MTFPLPENGPKTPQKISLVTQTVGILKDNINAGFWSEQLPGEHELCEHLHVSRVTLRKALAKLEQAGWVHSGQGRRRRIAPRPRCSPAASNRVILLTESPLHLLHPFTIYWMDCLREHLNETGYHLEIHTGQAAFGSSAERSLAQMQKQFHPAGWVLYRSNERMQRWFSAQSLPCVIAGSRHPNIRLPSVDVDYRATCRHAVGQFLARQHQRLVFLNPASGAAGDLESEQGFLAAAQSGHSPETQATVVRHDGTVEGLCKKLDLLLERPRRPTAFLVSRPAFVLTAVSHLLRKKLNLPRDVALISRDNDSFMENIVPTVARYASSPTVFARKVSRLVLEIVRGAALSSADVRIMPSFVSGQTLG
jgi:DNA-binding LacI/PurR family transcriptional regulator